MNTLLREIDFAVIRVVLLASPGFVKVPSCSFAFLVELRVASLVAVRTHIHPYRHEPPHACMHLSPGEIVRRLTLCGSACLGSIF